MLVFCGKAIAVTNERVKVISATHISTRSTLMPQGSVASSRAFRKVFINYFFH